MLAAKKIRQQESKTQTALAYLEQLAVTKTTWETDFLSSETGALPRLPVAKSLPCSHAYWDSLANDMPRLIRYYRVQEVLDDLPPLAADKSALPDVYVTRALMILTACLHAYCYYSNREGASKPSWQSLPKGITAPLEMLFAREGRQSYSRLYSDDFGYNWFICPDSGELKPIVTYFDEPEECQTTLVVGVLGESAFAQAVQAMACAAQAAGEGDKIGLTQALTKITVAIRHVSDLFQQLVPSEGGLDPSLFVQTFYTIGSATHEEGKANFGADALLFRLLDAFFHRRYRSELGEAIVARRALLPKTIQIFCQLLEQGPDVPAIIASMNYYDKEAIACLRQYKECEAAYRNLLRVHRVIAVQYMKVALLTADEKAKPWIALDQRLRVSEKERFSELVREESATAQLELPLQLFTDHRAITACELAEHYTLSDGWMALGGYVYDMTQFIHAQSYRGSHKLLLCDLGKIVTDFDACYDSAWLRRLQPVCVGKFVTPTEMLPLYAALMDCIHALINADHLLALHGQFTRSIEKFFLMDDVLLRYGKQAHAILIEKLNALLNFTCEKTRYQSHYTAHALQRQADWRKRLRKAASDSGHEARVREKAFIVECQSLCQRLHAAHAKALRELLAYGLALESNKTPDISLSESIAMTAACLPEIVVVPG